MMEKRAKDSLPINLFPTQSAFIFSKATIAVLFANMGEGKTFAGAIALMVHAERNKKDIRGAIIRDTHENIKTSTRVSIQETFNEYKIDYRFKNDYKELTIFSKFKVFVDLFGIDDPGSLTKLQGPEYAIIWLEEPAPIIDRSNAGLPETVFNMALARCARQKGVIPRLQITMNPADQSHWTYKRLILTPDEDPEYPLITKRVYRIPPGENKSLSEMARQATKAAYKDDAALFSRYVKGEFAPVYRGTKVTPEYNPTIHKNAQELIPTKGLDGFRAFDGWHSPTPYDQNTEILTIDGWKYIKDINVGNDVVTLNPISKEIEVQKVECKIIKEYLGKMYHWKSQNVDIRVTPDHAMPYLLNGNFNVVKAENATFRMVLPGKNIWIGKKIDKFILPEYIDPIGRIKLPIEIDGDIFCGLMGIYLSEGSCCEYKERKSDLNKNHCSVSIYQKEKNKDIGDLLSNTPFIWQRKEGVKVGGWHNHCRQLWKYLKEFGKSYEKYIPSEIKNAIPEQIKLFLKFYLIGDGSEGRRIVTSSKIMADDLQEICLKAGYRASIYEKNNIGRETIIRGKKCIIKRKYYIVDISFYGKTQNLTKYNLSIEDTGIKELVYCVTVPNHIVYVRRNGKACWGGNCLMGQITTAGRLVFIDTLHLDNSDIRTLIKSKVLPALNNPKWRDMCRSWRDIGDFSMMIPDQSNKQESAARVIERELDTIFEPGPAKWEHMKIGVKNALQSLSPKGLPMIQINPREGLLDQALSGEWHYPTDNSGMITSKLPEKNNASHIADAFANAVNVLLPLYSYHKDKTALKKLYAQMRQRVDTYGGEEYADTSDIRIQKVETDQTVGWP